MSQAANGLVTTLRERFAGTNIPAFELTLPSGEMHAFGSNGGAPAARDVTLFRVNVRTQAGLAALASLDDLAIGEAYLNGDFDIEGQWLAAFELRRHFSDRHFLHSLLRFVRPFLRGRTRIDKEVIPRHYDRGNEFYWSFLDRRHRLYSQALYRSENESLEEAVSNKLEYIYESCRLGPGAQVLDVGAGWGSFSCFAAGRGVDVTMLTLSHEQFDYLRELSRDESCRGRLTPVLESIYEYESDRRYDAIVVLGVMEHLPDYVRLFRRFSSLLEPGGFVYLDFVATRKKYRASEFTHRHVFEGNHSPVVMPELVAAANKEPFELRTVHNDRHSYYLTAKAWAERLEAARERIVGEFGERAFRLFQLYLWSVASCLHHDGDLESYRVVLQKSLGLPSTEVGLV